MGSLPSWEERAPIETVIQHVCKKERHIAEEFRKIEIEDDDGTDVQEYSCVQYVEMEAKLYKKKSE